MFSSTPISLTSTPTDPYTRLDAAALRHVHPHLDAPTYPGSLTAMWETVTSDTMHSLCATPQKMATMTYPIGYRTIAINGHTTQPDTGAITYIHRLTRHNILDTLSWDMSTFSIVHIPHVRTHHDTIYVLDVPELGPRKLYWRDLGADTSSHDDCDTLHLGFWDSDLTSNDEDVTILNTDELLAAQEPALLNTPSVTDADKDRLVTSHPVISHYLDSVSTTSAQALFAHPAFVAFLASRSAHELTGALFGTQHVRKDTVRLVGQASVDILLHLWDLYGHHDITVEPYTIPTDYIASRARTLIQIRREDTDTTEVCYSMITTAVHSSIMDMLYHHRHNVWCKIIHTPTDNFLVLNDITSARQLAAMVDRSYGHAHRAITKLCTTTARDLSKTKTFAALVSEARYVSIDNPEPNNRDNEYRMADADTLEWATQTTGPGQQWRDHDCPHTTPAQRKQVIAELTSDADRQRNTSAMISRLWTVFGTGASAHFSPAQNTDVSAQNTELVAFVQATEQDELRTWGHDAMMRHCIGGYPITEGIYLAHLTINKAEYGTLITQGELSGWSPTGYTAHTEQGARGSCTVDLVHTNSATAAVRATMSYTTHIPSNKDQYSYTSYGYRNSIDHYHDARKALINNYILTTAPRR